MKGTQMNELVAQIIIDLESEWEKPGGFLGNLRVGQFDPKGVAGLLDILGRVNANNEILISRRLVSLIWYIPIFMTWQRERVSASGVNAEIYNIAINQVETLVEKILGVP